MAPENDILLEIGEHAPELAKLLGNTKAQTPYQVPEGYFETLKMPGTQAPVRTISFGSRIFKYAVAAVLTGIIALTVWYTVQPEPTKNNVVLANSIDSISDDEIEKYMVGYISVLNYELGSSVSDIKDEDLTLMLTDIPDKELESFLN